MNPKDYPVDDKPLLVFKYGGNAMVDKALRKQVLANLCALTDQHIDLIIVHGGGPFIQSVLDTAGIQSEFIRGQRKTSPEAMPWVEMALKGKVNGELVGEINHLGYRAVGLSGKDGMIVEAEKYLPLEDRSSGADRAEDLGRVGKVKKINASLIRILLKEGYVPVITCIASDASGMDYNINADLFAAGIAGAMQATEFILLTDIDGLLRDKNDPSTLISSLSVDEIAQLVESGIVQGGMIPKLAACRLALQQGAENCRILNGTKPDILAEFSGNTSSGTKIS